MTLRFQRRLLLIAGFGLLASAAALAVASWQLDQPAVDRQAAIQSPESTDEEPESAGTSSQLDASQEVWKRALRRPLYDPPPPPPSEVVKKKLPPLRSKLRGTIIQPGASQAMIEVPGGTVQFRSEGDELGAHDAEAVLVEIGPTSIKVARGDEITELRVESPY